MTLFFQRVFDGLANGSLYGALALAVVLVFRCTGRVNLAQGELATFGTYVSLVLTSPVGPAVAGTALAARLLPATPWPMWLAIPAAMVISAVLAAALERFVVRRIPERSPRTAVSLTVGLLLGLNAITTTIWSNRPRGYTSPFPSDPTDQFVFGTVRLRYATVGTWVTLLVVLALLRLLLVHTRFGLAFRAVSSSRMNSALNGVRVGRILTAGWALAAALGTLVGCLAASRLILAPDMMVRLLVYAFVAATIGGLSSPGGALLGGVLVGVGQSMIGGYVPGVDGVLAFPVLVGAMVVMLYLRPHGLFGERSVGDPSDEPGPAAPSAALAPARWTLAADAPIVRVGKVVVVVAGLAVAVVPAFALPFVEARLWTEVVATAVALWGLALLVGDAGRISLSHATFMGVGAYGTAIAASRYGVPPLAGISIAVIAGFVLGVAVGLPALRIRGQYLAMVTLCLAVIFPSLLNRFKWFTGGELGPRATELPREPSWFPLPDGRPFAWLHLIAVAIAVVVLAGLRSVRASRPGRAVRATAQHELAAAAMGIPATRIRALVFGLAAALAALAGSIIGIQTQAVTASRFGLFQSLALYALLSMWGAPSLLGATLAALSYVGTPWLAQQQGWTFGARGVPPDAPGGTAYLVWGIALVALTALTPDGIVPTLHRRLRRLIRIDDRTGSTPAGQPAVARRPAASPANRPNTDPLTRPVPPG